MVGARLIKEFERTIQFAVERPLTWKMDKQYNWFGCQSTAKNDSSPRSPEITTIACVSVAETAAEKLVSLTRRTAGTRRRRRRALAALETEHHFAQRYTEFLQLMVYGVKPDFAEAMATIASLVRRL
jgi:hypothetical protein